MIDLEQDVLSKPAILTLRYNSTQFSKIINTIYLGNITRYKREAFNWIRIFLTNCSQTVFVNGAKFQPKEVVSGVPQGSVFGPLIFFILNSDINERISKSFISSFANNTRISYIVGDPNGIAKL